MTEFISHFSLNGQPVANNFQAVNLLRDRGLAYGHGLFETIRMHQGFLPLIDRHLARLVHGAKSLNIPINSTLIEEYLGLFLEQLKNDSISAGVVKLIVTAGVGGRGYLSPQKIEPAIICSFSELPNDYAMASISPMVVRYCDHRLPMKDSLAGIKHLNRLDQILARNEWQCDKYQEGLMFNTSNQLIEAISANVFIKNSSGDWVTPCLKGAGVSGVMRSVMIEEVFPRCDISITIGDVSMDELARCQQFFICNSIRGLIPVHSIYNNHDQLVKSLPLDQQTFLLSNKLVELFPHY